MREIKFRGWNGEIFIYGGAPVPNFRGGYSYVRDGYDKFIYEDEVKAIEQYTGLKDKNGVEIYESDILKVTRSNPVWDENIVDYSVVEYGNCKFFVDIGTKKLTVSNNYWGTTMEVIGNIHENPELLD